MLLLLLFPFTSPCPHLLIVIFILCVSFNYIIIQTENCGVTKLTQLILRSKDSIASKPGVHVFNYVSYKEMISLEMTLSLTFLKCWCSSEHLLWALSHRMDYFLNLYNYLFILLSSRKKDILLFLKLPFPKIPVSLKKITPTLSPFFLLFTLKLSQVVFNFFLKKAIYTNTKVEKERKKVIQNPTN